MLYTGQKYPEWDEIPFNRKIVTLISWISSVHLAIHTLKIIAYFNIYTINT